MTGPLLKTLLKAGVYFGISEILLKGKSSERRIQHIVLGIVFILLAGAVAFLGAIGALAALFFSLADLHSYVRPAVIAALMSLAGALGLFWEGKRRFSTRPLSSRK